MSQRAVIVTDAHINSTEDADFFANFLNTVLQRGDSLYILGDFFSVWLGLKKVQESFHLSVISELKKTGGNGIKIHYIEGNRDFFLKNSFLEDIFSSISESETVLESGEQKYLLTHGDTLNRKDRQYLLWRKLSKNILLRLLTKATPSFILKKTIGSAEMNMKKTNRANRISFPEEEIVKLSETYRKQGFQGLITGHFHKEKIINFNGFGIYCLPDWKENPSYLEICENSSPVLKKFERF